MNEPLDELYLTWLYRQIGVVRVRHSTKTYWTLLRQLFKKEFVFIVANDDNRAKDGINLRYEFVGAERIEDIDQNWLDLACSMLEMLVALARRLEFEADRTPSEWFWELMRNLNLDHYHDKSHYPHDKVDAILNRVIFRTYAADGSGGLFPLRRPEHDQREIEIWYQLNAYLIENT